MANIGKPAVFEMQFNFNSHEPLPWHDPNVPQFEGVRQFARCNDNDLLDYLHHRRVAEGFLVEIDMFLRSHPEIVKYAPKFIKLINSLPPLEAYLYFLRGYTRPARYLDGLIMSEGFYLPPSFRPVSITTKRDRELDDFFEGFDYRYDILDRIDAEVMYACINLQHGRFVSPALRRLVCYAVFGHPVDAYKFYEYNYQQEYMPHRYLPEHVVLGEIPKPVDYREPAPSSIHGFKKHRDIRYHMAQAKDQGVDVIDVLLSDFRSTLVKKGLKRRDIDTMCREAENRIDSERRSPQGVDIVDMIMGLTDNVQMAAKAFPTRPANPVTIPKIYHRGPRKQTVLIPAAKQLRKEKNHLARLYAQEESTSPHVPCLRGLQRARGNTERRYVHALIKYGKDMKQMDSKTATDLASRFTRKNMDDMVLVYKTYLFSLYPRELQ